MGFLARPSKTPNHIPIKSNRCILGNLEIVLWITVVPRISNSYEPVWN